MRYVIVPADVVLEDFEGKQIPLTFREGGAVAAGTPWSLGMWLGWFVFSDTRLGDTAKSAKSAKKIRKAFKGCKVGDSVALEDADWSLLRDIIEKPTQPQPGTLAAQFADFMDAIIAAREEAPLKAVPTTERSSG